MGTFIVLVILAAIVALIIVFLIRKKKSGEPSCSSCGVGCSGCSAKDYCDSNDDVEGLRTEERK